jgi:hypothetical protein
MNFFLSFKFSQYERKDKSHIQNISINRFYEIDFKHNVQQKFHN